MRSATSRWNISTMRCIPRRPRLALEPADQQQGGDVVGQVGGDHRLGRSAGDELAPIGRQRIAEVHLEAARIALGDGLQRRRGSARRAPPPRRARRPPATARA